MPWQEQTTMSLRQEFITLAQQPTANISQLCRRFGISRKTAYKWLARAQSGEAEALADRSRRPHHSPLQTEPAVEAAVVGVRTAHPTWGGRKIRAWLLAPPPSASDAVRLPAASVPTASTITTILRRHNRLDPTTAAPHRPFQRFEHAAPNDLWQMDFKGDFALLDGPPRRCYPLTVLDDHSRFAVGLAACGDQQATTVQAQLTAIFRRYGLPYRMTMDHGAPSGSDAAHPYTVLTVWLLRLGICVSHSRPYHPQTQGKDERFHRTLKAELLGLHPWRTLAECQARFEPWRLMYNLERPHEALDLAVPASRYQPSPRAFPETLPPIEYGPSDIVRKVQAKGQITYHQRPLVIGRAFAGYPVALRRTTTEACFDVYFCQHRVAHVDWREPLSSS